MCSYMVQAGEAECRDVVKHPLMPAGTGPRLPQMRSGNVGYPEGAALMYIRSILAEMTPSVRLFSYIFLNTYNHVMESRGK